MIAWKLFKHAFGMLWRNLGSALKISLIPFAVIMTVFGLFFGTMVAGAGPYGPAAPPTGGMFAMIVVGIVCGTAIAVNWHRFVLLNEPAGWVPRLHGVRIIAYLLQLVLIGLLLGGGFGIASVVASLLMTGGGAVALLGAILMLALMVFALAAYWRLGASLPGAALDDGAGIGETWRATKGNLGTFVVLALILFGFAIAIGVVQMLAMFVPLIGILIYLAVEWFLGMLGLSLLTTVYGYYVEKRELV